MIYHTWYSTSYQLPYEPGTAKCQVYVHRKSVSYLPVLRVVRGYREANLGARVEPPVGRVEHDVRRSERILRREQDAAVVDPPLELRLRRTSQREVPLEQVAFKRRGVVLVGGVLHELPDIGVYPLDGRILDVHRHLARVVLLQVVVVVVVWWLR